MIHLVRKRRRTTAPALSHRQSRATRIQLASSSTTAVLLLVLLCSTCSFVRIVPLAMASQSTAAGLQYPNKNLGPSLAASAAASTVVAVTAPASSAGEGGQEEGNCCVILTKSVAQQAHDDEESDVDSALMISPETMTMLRGSSDIKGDPDDEDDDINASIAKQEEILQPICPGRYSPSLSILSTSSSPLVLALTGFGPDVHHLSLSAAKVYSNHVQLYGGTVMRTDKMATVMADRLASAAMSEGSRPYGVQALVVGDRLVSTNGSGSGGSGSGSGAGGEMQLYTIDPAGGFRHWSGGGTAVGRDADMVRACLSRYLRPVKRGNGGGSADTSGRGTPSDWTDALDRALMATIEASVGDDSDGGRYDEDGYAKSGRYRAIVAFSRGHGTRTSTSMHGNECKCFQIGAEAIKDSYKRCVRLLKEEENDRMDRASEGRKAN